MEKKIKKMLILLSIILVIFILIYIFNPLSQAKFRLTDINKENKLNESVETVENIHYIMGVYKGELTTQIMTKSYNNLAKNIIPKYFEFCKGLSREELGEYYKKNSDIIFVELGYESFEEFEKFVEKIKIIEADTLEFKSYRILDNSVTKTNNKTKAYIEFVYNNDNKLVFESIISRDLKKKSTSIKLEPSVDENIIEKDKKSYENRMENFSNQKSPFTRGSPIEE